MPQIRGVGDLEDIEELIWSPILGLKGKIDDIVSIRSEAVPACPAVVE